MRAPTNAAGGSEAQLLRRASAMKELSHFVVGAADHLRAPGVPRELLHLHVQPAPRVLRPRIGAVAPLDELHDDEHGDHRAARQRHGEQRHGLARGGLEEQLLAVGNRLLDARRDQVLEAVAANDGVQLRTLGRDEVNRGVEHHRQEEELLRRRGRDDERHAEGEVLARKLARCPRRGVLLPEGKTAQLLRAGRGHNRQQLAHEESANRDEPDGVRQTRREQHQRQERNTRNEHGQIKLESAGRGSRRVLLRRWSLRRAGTGGLERLNRALVVAVAGVEAKRALVRLQSGGLLPEVPQRPPVPCVCLRRRAQDRRLLGVCGSLRELAKLEVRSGTVVEEDSVAAVDGDSLAVPLHCLREILGVEGGVALRLAVLGRGHGARRRHQ
mmetsp:Transcript_51882/g.159878  ORF Transcript_51882/g.159878 Transcript_51882/m.159878 type:complete len:385 (-) Transcript_51882:21-1175(-)